MPIDIARLKHHIEQRGLTGKKIANTLGIDESTYYRKLATGGTTFSISQVQILTDMLMLSKEEASKIFLP